MVLLIILGLGALGGVVYMALSSKSTFKLRVVALGALVLMILTVIVCLFVYFRTDTAPKQLILPDTLPSDIPPPSSGDSPLALIVFVIFLVGLFVAIFMLAMREQKRADGKKGIGE